MSFPLDFVAFRGATVVLTSFSRPETVAGYTEVPRSQLQKTASRAKKRRWADFESLDRR